MMDVKIFGERNTATRALKEIIQLNSASVVIPSALEERGFNLVDFLLEELRLSSVKSNEQRSDAVFSRYGERASWKHCATNFKLAQPFKDAYLIFTVRHPASWILSLYQNPYHLLHKKPSSIGDFLHFDWKTVARERLDQKSFKPLSLYQKKINAYKAFCKMLATAKIPFSFVKFEDLILNQEKTFQTLSSNLTNVEKDFSELRKSTKSQKKSLDYYKNYYGKELWRKELVEVRVVLNDMVNWELFSEFDYSPL
jgi:hypothetical protein